MNLCRYSWLKREGMTERGVEPCGECEACTPTAIEFDADDRLEGMRAEAESLGIKVRSDAKPETIERKITEARAAAEVASSDA